MVMYAALAYTASGAKTPTLVIHGELDYRVPATQALQYYDTLHAKGVIASGGFTATGELAGLTTAEARLQIATHAIAIVPTDFDNRRDVDLFVLRADYPVPAVTDCGATAVCSEAMVCGKTAAHRRPISGIRLGVKIGTQTTSIECAPAS